MMVLDERGGKHQTGPGPYAIAFLDYYQGNTRPGPRSSCPGSSQRTSMAETSATTRNIWQLTFAHTSPYSSAVVGFR